MLSSRITNYLNDSKINGRFARWQKPVVNVFITPLLSVNNPEYWYSKVDEAIVSWNRVLRENSIFVQFNKISSAASADIVVHWVKVGRVYEGMCKYVSVVNGEFKKISIEIGMPNSFSGKDTTDLSIYCAIMHEFGHALGLGHGVEVDDIMFVPHQKNISVPSENDIYVLKQIYSL